MRALLSLATVSRNSAVAEAVASYEKSASGLLSRNLALGAVAFLLLTIAVFWFQVVRIQADDAAPAWHQLRWGYLVLIVLCLPVETLTAGLRLWVICRTLEPGVSLWTCIKADWANAAISLLTPSQSGGGPGQIYILNREGTSVGTALTISALSFVGTMVGLLGLGLYSLLVSGLRQTGPLFVGALWALSVITATLLLAAVAPSLFRAVIAAISRTIWRMRGGRQPLREWRPPHDAGVSPEGDRMGLLAATLVDIIYTYRHDVERFLRVGKASFGWVCLLSVTFLFARAFLAALGVRFLGIETSTLWHIVEIQMALIFLTFFAPTPGGAGVAESASLSILTEIVPVGFAPSYTLLWRFSTAYLPALVGLGCLLRALQQDARKIIRR